MKSMYQKSYLSFFSTYSQVTTTDPKQMMVPIDDHGFHRGDGVFEAIKWIDKNVWLLDPHLNRLQSSCDRIGIKLPMPLAELKHKIQELLILSKKANGLIRLFVTRGPGSFGISPYESIGAQIYIVTTDLPEWSMERVQKGVSVQCSTILPKLGVFAQVKSLNYLPNVLMKKEAVDKGFDFGIGVGLNNEVLESSTENIGYIKDDKLVTPKFDSTLRGTTLHRLAELVSQTMEWSQKSFSFSELQSADEVFLVGTTIDVLPVTNVDGVSKNRIQKVLALRELLLKDQRGP